MQVGYVRISTKEQNTARQDVLMEELGVERVFTDKVSGKNRERPELHRMMDFVREGDSVIVESISRFARNTTDALSLFPHKPSLSLLAISVILSAIDCSGNPPAETKRLKLTNCLILSLTLSFNSIWSILFPYLSML